MSPAFIVTKENYPSAAAIQMAFFYIFSLLPNEILSFLESTYVSQVCVCIKKTFHDHSVHIHNQSRKNIPFPLPKDFVVVCR